MKKILIFLCLLISVGALAQRKTPAVKKQRPPVQRKAPPMGKPSMGKALEIWSKGDISGAMLQFEKLAEQDQTNWIPAYYLTLLETTNSFDVTNHRDKMNQIDKARARIEGFLETERNAEWLNLLALNYASEVSIDPLGKKALSQNVAELYEEALALEPQNPRALYGRAAYNIREANYFGKDKTAYCEELKKALVAFDNQKSEVPFYPKWGQDQAQKLAKTECVN
ncbi:hypothetical protein [Flavobacterium sp. JP2137]|uniref:hypothetical protein n=1 Tax=Flavobacterium sp. JP2137 TaxID=3414510 RepID=UPI003D2FA543